MATPVQMADAPPEIDSQARIAALGITIGQFVKTMRGMSLVNDESRFVLQGRLYQGFNEKALEVTEDLCSDAEIDAAEDIDGTKQGLLDTRRRRLELRTYARDREHGERKKLKIAQQRDEIELRLLQRQLDKQDAEDAAVEAAKPPEVFACKTCGAEFASEPKLRGHKVGAKH